MYKLMGNRSINDFWNPDREIDRRLSELRTPWGINLPRSWFVEPLFTGDNLEIDLYEKGDSLFIKAALPGVKAEDINIDEQNGVLTIQASSKTESEQAESGWRVRERRYGVWRRSVRLPQAVKAGRGRAELRAGVLTVELPKVESKRKLVNRIKVNAPKWRLPWGKKEAKIEISHN